MGAVARASLRRALGVRRPDSAPRLARWFVRARIALALGGGAAALALSPQAAPPPLSLFPFVNAAFTLSTGRRSRAGESGPVYKFVGGGFASVEACGSAAAAWMNASDPAQRCLSATFFRAPQNVSFAGQCYCNVEPRWIPAPSAEADSARLLWPCTVSPDACSYNGECDAGSGQCRCDAAWGGPRCSELQLLPVDAARPGLRLVDPQGRNVSTWGAPMLRDPASGTWHAWPSEIEYGCGLNSWQTNSHVVHATADSPGGPWTRREEVFGSFAHEPDVVFGPGGELVIVLSYFELPNSTEAHCTACADGISLALDSKTGCGPNRTHAFRQMLAVAPGFDRPFGAPFEIVGPSSFVSDWNLAITINASGSAVGVIRELFPWAASNFSNNATWHAVNVEPGGSQGPPLPDSSVEDPHIYVDRRGVFHAVVHSQEQTPGGAMLEFCGGHAYSLDGATWHYTGFAYGNAANYSDGSWQAFARRERPHLLFAADGVTPIALSNGVQFAAPPGIVCKIDGNAAPCDPIFTLVQPVRTD